MGGGGIEFPGGTRTLTLDGTNNDLSSDTHNSFLITTTAGFGSDTITLPPAADNIGRVIAIKNVGNKTVIVSNAFSVTAVINTRAALFISDGTHWVNSSN